MRFPRSASCRIRQSLEPGDACGGGLRSAFRLRPGLTASADSFDTGAGSSAGVALCAKRDLAQPRREASVTKYIFVSGGVVSSVGKGITVASLGRLLRGRGVSVCLLKLDPYINVDPGTMSPYQHGEVFVTDDGAETDLDLGHYERFIDANLTRMSNVTTGQVY